MIRSRLFPLTVFALSSCISPASPAHHADASPLSTSVSGAGVLVNRDHHGLALEGYDPVAYFTDGQPVLGSADITAVHLGASYHFASEDHRWLFLREPERYLPAFGGFCGYAASVGRISPADPRHWQILEGRLIVQHDQAAFDLFNAAPALNLASAERHWSRIERDQALPPHYVVNADPAGVAMAGFDPISYFDGAPTLGRPEHASRYGGALYHFASEANRARFEGDPARYAPLFGGFCGYAASLGVFAPIDPSQYLIMEGRLVLQRSAEALALFNRAPRQNLARANANWPQMVGRAGL
ncbi:MAG TPA: YHS domain-containing (seleno)protein [Polyangiales bacterium]